MNCTRCQTVNGPASTFCSNCGTSLTPAASAGYVGPASYGTPAAPQYQPGQSGPFVQRSSALPPANFNLSRLTTVDRIVAGGTLVTMISLWLPWFSASYSGLGATTSASISGTGYHGWLWLEFLLALALVAYFAARAAWDQLPFRLPVSDEWLLAGATGLQFLLILIGFLAMPSTDGLAGYSVSWSFGAFLALVASITAAAPVVYPAAKSYLDSRRAGATRAS
jgi:hypothetical protein